MADGGTILLDEIGDMDVRLQAKLLQVLQDHEFQRIGGKDTIKVDVRVIAATHRDLETAIQERQVSRGPLLPAERGEPARAAAAGTKRRHRGAGRVSAEEARQDRGRRFPPITPELQTAMMGWNWPGNVRELENFARKLLIFQDPGSGRTRAERTRGAEVALSAAQAPAASSERGRAAATLPILEQVTKAKQQAEADAILTALNTTRWNRKQAVGAAENRLQGAAVQNEEAGRGRQAVGGRRGFPPPRNDRRRIVVTGRGVRSTEIFNQSLTLLPNAVAVGITEIKHLTCGPLSATRSALFEIEGAWA